MIQKKKKKCRTGNKFRSELQRRAAKRRGQDEKTQMVREKGTTWKADLSLRELALP